VAQLSAASRAHPEAEKRSDPEAILPMPAAAMFPTAARIAPSKTDPRGGSETARNPDIAVEDREKEQAEDQKQGWCLAAMVVENTPP